MSNQCPLAANPGSGFQIVTGTFQHRAAKILDIAVESESNAVFINDNEPRQHHDYDKWLEELIPFAPSLERYHHNRTGEDNADAHRKRQIMGREVVVAITDGRLHLGPWEHIFITSSIVAG